MNVFNHVRDGGEEFVESTRALFVPENNNKDAYNRLRAEFNNAKEERRSALFIYLNRHCFNGLCRYNSKGGFNVPFGRYASPYFPGKEMLAFAKHSAAARFEVADFEATMDMAKPGDVVYCDPPYVPLSQTSNFTDYTLQGFGVKDQERLVEKAAALARKGIPVVISNHGTEETIEQYEAAGAEVKTFEVQRFISCDATNRGKATELLAVFARTSTVEAVT
jgi:DNA adenine methylase